MTKKRNNANIDQWIKLATLVGALTEIVAFAAESPVVALIAVAVVVIAIGARLVLVGAFPALALSVVAVLIAVMGVVLVVILWPITVTGVVFVDYNFNGIQDGIEPLVPGQSLVLTDNNGVEHNTITNREGKFEVGGVPRGTFTIRLTNERGRPGVAGPGSPVVQVPMEPTDTPTPTPTPTLTLTPTPSPTPTPTDTLTQTFTDTPTPSPIPTPECRFNNLINCGVPVPVVVDGQSRVTTTLTSEGLIVGFSNDQAFSGVALQFTPALDVRGFTRLDISGTATQDFKFRIEYKVLVGIQPTVVISSTFQSFPATTQVSTIRIPLNYSDAVDEIALMFYEPGEASLVTIESIRLSR